MRGLITNKNKSILALFNSKNKQITLGPNSTLETDIDEEMLKQIEEYNKFSKTLDREEISVVIYDDNNKISEKNTQQKEKVTIEIDSKEEETFVSVESKENIPTNLENTDNNIVINNSINTKEETNISYTQNMSTTKRRRRKQK